MNGSVYTRLAREGIRKNRKLYLPFIITASFKIMVTYILGYLSSDECLALIPEGRRTTGVMMDLGMWVVVAFSLIFLYYTYSFIIRRRQKEFGLYNVLGMDKKNISREKLAYLIDATAAPVCIIAPISSWAAAVSGFVEGENGMKLFLQTIPYNFYAVLTIVMMVMLVMFRVDYGPMRKHEINAIEKNDLFTTTDRAVETNPEENMREDGHVLNMLVPIVSLIICCVIGMIYSGGFFSGTGFIDAFAGSDASVGLVLGSASALVITIAFYLIGNVLSFDDCMASLPDGFKAMIAPILILTFAWSLKAMTDSLGAKEFVAAVVEHSAANYLSFLPFIIFLISVGLSFATGTSWGTFGILIPIVVACFEGIDHTMMIIAMSACMAGAVCGDHCSPISDTTIMSSAGAQCVHINHVYTQLPYALTAAAISALAYIVAGITKSAVISLIVGAIAIAAVLFMIRSKTGIEKE